MTTTTHHPARGLSPLAWLRTLAIAVLLAGAGSDACAAVTVSISSIQPVASEAALTTGVIQFNRDTSSGPLVVYFTLSGAAATTNSITLPTFTATSSAALSLVPYATSGSITIADGHGFEQLVITPLDNSSITGDLPLVVTVSPDPNNIYTVVGAPETAQIDIAEGDYQASVLVPAPVAYENTALVGNANDPNAPRRGILRVSFFPIATFPGSAPVPGLTQFYLSNPSESTLAAGSTITIGPTTTNGVFTATTTAEFVEASSNFISFTPGISVGIPIGATVTSGSFTGTINLVPPAAPSYDKALKVQFGGSAPLPATATGAITGTATDAYYVTYKIGGSAMGSATNTVSNGTGWNQVAYPGSTAIPRTGTTIITLLQGGPLPAGSQVFFSGNSSFLYTTVDAYAGGPGVLTINGGLQTSVHDGDAVTAVADSLFLGVVSAPVQPGTTQLFIENGSGTLNTGDVFTLAGEDTTKCRYVITSVTPGPIAGDLTITLRRYTAGTVSFGGVNNLHSANVPGSFPSPALSTVFNVSDDAPFSGTTNLSADGGIEQLLIPAESALVDFGINPIDNALNDPQLTVSMSLFSNLNYAATTPTAGELIIAGADSTASIQTTANAVQGAPPATSTNGSFTISLTEAFSQDMTVPFTITGNGPDVGQPGIDYVLSSASSFAVDNGIYSVVIPANSTSATVTVTPVPTAQLGVSGKTVTLTLSPTYNYLLAAASGNLNASATLSLLPPPPPVPQLSVSTLINAQQPAVNGDFEIVGQFTISAQVAPVSDLSVQYTLSGTAAPGTDYLTPAGYHMNQGYGVATILAGTTSVQVLVDPNTVPLPPYKASDIATITLLPAGTYTLTSVATSSASLNIAQGQIQVNEVTSETANGTYHVGDTIIIDVTFSAPVTVSSGTPTLALNTGATTELATYLAPTGSPPPAPTATMRFSYTVANGDVSPRLDYVSVSALVATIQDANLGSTHIPLFPVSTTLPAPATTGSLFSNSDLVIDGTPAVALDPLLHLEPTEVGPTAGYFWVTCTPSQSGPVTVNYILGGTAVVNTDIAPLGGTPGQLVIPAGATSYNLVITPLDNLVVNPDETVTLTLLPGTGYHLVTPATASATTTDTLTVAQNAIGVLSVTSPTANGTYTIGNAITVALNFSAPVSVSGTPQLALNSGASAVATYASGSGSSTLLFTYTVGVGDASAALDYPATTSLTGGTLTATSGSLPVQLGLPTPGAAASLAGSSALVINGSPAIALNPAAHLNTSALVGSLPGQFVVTCTPAPTSDLTVTYTLGGSATVNTVIAAPANFIAATSTGTLTILANQTSAILAITPESNQTLTAPATVVMSLVAGAGYALANSPAVTTDSVTVAQNAIVVTGVSAQPTSGTFYLGSQITIQVTFSAPVDVVSGTPQLALNTGATNAIATLAGGNASGSGTATLNFTYVVGADDSSAHLDYLSPTALNGGVADDPGLNGGVISDHSGNNLPVSTILALPGKPGSLSANTSLVINGTVPVVTELGAISPNGTYTFGQSLTLTVTFSLPVNVSGTPELQLDTGPTPAEATFAGGNGTNTLQFTYVVGANDASANLDCTSASALTLNGGSITWDGPGAANAELGLPDPGAAGSLGANTALVINGTLPAGKPPVGSITGPDAGTGGGCGLGSGVAGLAGALALCLRAAALRRHRRGRR